MRRIARLLLVTFLESFATICVERGIYFFSTARLGFSDADNLRLALVFGVSYAAGAMCSHVVAARWREKVLLLWSLIAQLFVHAGLGAWTAAGFAWLSGAVFVGNGLLGFLYGIKWPVVESYVSAGWTPAETSRVIGLFNVHWASAVPLALAATGPLVAHFPAGLLLLPALINVVSLWLLRNLPARPTHLPPDHPERPPEERLVRLRRLLTASRWQMLCSYSLLWILAALLPRILRDAGFSVQWASGLSGLLDLVRLTAFVVLGLWTGWHDRASPVVLGMIGLPVGFFAVVFGGSAPIVLLGEVVFGLSAGVIYYSALYYAMVVKNAAVEAGGVHEGLIGAGFAVGPAAGLIGVALTPILGGEVLGTLAGVGPVMVLCAVGAIRHLRAVRSRMN